VEHLAGYQLHEKAGKDNESEYQFHLQFGYDYNGSIIDKIEQADANK
jgi:hypothetical protein